MNHSAPTTGTALSCTDADPDLFFAERPEDIRAAMRICQTCPAIRACLRGALERAEPCGVWGGEYFAGGVPAAPPGRALWGAGLPLDPPAGVDTVTIGELAAMLDRTARYVLKMLRDARNTRAAGEATGLELPEPCAGGAGGRPFRWPRRQAELFAERNPRQRARRHPVAA